MTAFSIRDAAAAEPSALALAADGHRLTYAELAERVERVAAALHDEGLLDGGTAPVGLVARSSPASLEALLALALHGVPALLLSPRLPEAERAALVARAGARAVLAPDFAPLRSPRRAPEPPPEIDAESPLAILPTSGTSGRRKLVVLSRRALAASARASSANLPLGPGDRWLLCLPLAHVGGLSVVTRALLARSAVVGFDAGERGLLRSLPELAACLERERVTVASLVPTVLDALLALEPAWTPPALLRAVLLGGAATPVALLERARARGVPVLTTYGLTEAASQVTTTPFGQVPAVDGGGVVGAGRALAGTELAVRADGGLRVRGDTLCSGYVDDTPPFDADGWLVTGDRARLGPDGELFVLGRASELIVTGGENVDPSLVEAALEGVPGVRAALVFGVPDPRFGELVACAVVADPPLDWPRVEAALAARLAPHERPRRAALAASLPLLENGKLDRALARRRFEPELRDVAELQTTRR